jgi:hypothetical protein
MPHDRCEARSRDHRQNHGQPLHAAQQARFPSSRTRRRSSRNDVWWFPADFHRPRRQFRLVRRPASSGDSPHDGSRLKGGIGIAGRFSRPGRRLARHRHHDDPHAPRAPDSLSRPMVVNRKAMSRRAKQFNGHHSSLPGSRSEVNGLLQSIAMIDKLPDMVVVCHCSSTKEGPVTAAGWRREVAAVPAVPGLGVSPRNLEHYAERRNRRAAARRNPMAKSASVPGSGTAAAEEAAPTECPNGFWAG